jgi:hypothetical protein
MRSEARRKVQPVAYLVHSIRIINFHINLGKVAFGESLMLAWGKLLRGGILILILERLHERHAVQHVV